MDVVSVVERVIRDHPLLDFSYKAEAQEVHWCICPCGFSTRHYRFAGAAQRAFKNHVTDEVNEELALVFADASAASPQRGLPLPTA